MTGFARLVVDTNVLVSGLYRLDSKPGRILLRAVEERLELYAPETVQEELTRVLSDVLDYDADEIRQTLTALPVEWIDHTIYEDHIPPASEAITDPDDAPIVALALALDAPVVTGDHDFHPLDEEIVTTHRPAEIVDETQDRDE